MEREICSHLEWQLNVDPSMVHDLNSLDIFSGMAAQRRSLDVGQFSGALTFKYLACMYISNDH